jgi:predicted glycogen debranching enzyme
MASTRGYEHDNEWLLSNGSGTFALGCIDRVPRRKYHSLFSLADGLGPQSSSRNLVMDIVESVGSGSKQKALVSPRGEGGQVPRFLPEPEPCWIYEFDGFRLSRRLAVPQAAEMPHAARPLVRVNYRLEPLTSASAKTPAAQRIEFEPWLLSRPLHMEMKLNTALWGTPLPGSGKGVWKFQVYPHEPVLRLSWKGIDPDWRSEGRWETDLAHEWEAQRGYPSNEDVFVPGNFSFTWTGREAIDFYLDIEWEAPAPLLLPDDPAQQNKNEKSGQVRDFKSRLRQAATQYSAAIREHGGLTPTLLAGLPWFGPWGRDNLISIPGYALATGRHAQAYAMIAAMGRRIRDALVTGAVGGPNTTHRGPATVNLHGVDTPFLFVWAIEKLQLQGALEPFQNGILRELACEIVEGMASGKHPGVEILAEGRVRLAPGLWAPTWMDARIEEHPVTSRHGEPIEINALFANALSYLRDNEDTDAKLSEPLREMAGFASRSVAHRYWRQDLGYFADTLGDGAADSLLRPNQLWLLALDRIDVDRAQARTALQVIRQQLLTPVGLRTLSPRAPSYRGRCEGNQRARDMAYHQGTVWPWLLGLFAEATIRFEGADAARKQLAPCLSRLEDHLNNEGCINQISEIFDGDEPHLPRGTPAQAWSVTELVRLLEAIER